MLVRGVALVRIVEACVQSASSHHRRGLEVIWPSAASTMIGWVPSCSLDVGVRHDVLDPSRTGWCIVAGVGEWSIQCWSSVGVMSHLVLIGLVECHGHANGVCTVELK